MRYAYYTLAFVVVLLVSVMGFRGMTSTRPPIEVFPDMDHQAKYKPQAESKFFADGRADRPIPPGAVPYGRAYRDRGQGPARSSRSADPGFPEGRRLSITPARMPTARSCAASRPTSPSTRPSSSAARTASRSTAPPCHGTLGDGNGITKSYGMVATPTYHDDRLRGLPEGEIFNTITNGKNTMFPVCRQAQRFEDRWAVIAYVRALQRAHHATIDDVPLEQRGGLK